MCLVPPKYLTAGQDKMNLEHPPTPLKKERPSISKMISTFLLDSVVVQGDSRTNQPIIDNKAKLFNYCDTKPFSIAGTIGPNMITMATRRQGIIRQLNML